MYFIIFRQTTKYSKLKIKLIFDQSEKWKGKKLAISRMIDKLKYILFLN